MPKPNGTVRAALLAVVALFIQLDSEGQDLGRNSNMESVATAYSTKASVGGVGAEQQAAVTRAVGLINQGQLAAAETMLDDVLGRFAGLMSDSNRTYVCFRETKDYDEYLSQLPAKPGSPAASRFTRVHISFAQALQMKAYIASSQKQWDRAIDFLNKKIAYAPYEAQPHLEMGYILNAQGKPQAAVDSYKKGYALAVAHDAVKTEQAVALRGMGSALIELGKLDDAVASFKKSLEIDPGNEVALSELKYIEEVRAGGR